MPTKNQYYRGIPVPSSLRPFWVGLVVCFCAFVATQFSTPEEEEDSLPEKPGPVSSLLLQIVDPDLNPEVKKMKPGKVVIDGLTAIDEAEAREMISLQLRKLEEGGVTMARADDAAFFLEQGIRDLGYDAAKVEWKITPDNQVILNVDEGEPLQFGTLNVSGNDNLSDDAVRELLTKVTRERLGLKIQSEEIPFVLGDVNEGIKAVRHIYELLGYSDATVELRGTEVQKETGTVSINVAVDEGTLVKVGDLNFPEPISPEVEKVYAEIRTESADRPFTKAVIANIADRVETAAKESGYFDASVSATPDQPRASENESGSDHKIVDLKIDSDWGERYKLGSVEVEGIEKIKDGIIDRRFEDLLGEPFSPTATNKVVESLLETGAFDALSVEPTPNLDGTISLSVDAEEAKRRRLAVYGGFSTYDGPIFGLEYRNSNFLSRLHTFEAKAEYTNRGLRGDVEHTNPWFLNTDWKSQISLYSRTQDHEGYEIFDSGGHFALLKKFGKQRKHQVMLFIKPEYSDITSFDIEEEFLGPQSYYLNRLGLVYSYGNKEDRIAGVKGLYADLALSGTDASLGSDLGFSQGIVRASYFLPIGKTKLRLGARAGIINPAEDEDLPIDLRFFTGGPRSVRSFRERDLGPSDKNGFPTGGEFMSVFNVEYDIPIAGPLSLVPFADAGNLLPNAEDASLDDMHYAAGLGLVFNSPIGPLRVEYGHNLNQSEGEPSGTWHVGFGFAF